MGGPGSGAKPKVDAPDLVDDVRRLYGSGLTQSEVGAVLGVTQKVIYTLMQRNGIPARVAAKRNQFGPGNHMWKGPDAGYQALHLRVEKARGKPSKCARCGTTDEHRTYDWANLTGHYELIEDYERMCRSCHRRYDAARRG